MKDYYKILNIQEDATEQEIKKAYYNAMKEWHPDRNLHRGEEATARSKEIVEAYTVLSDPEERSRYDYDYHKDMSGEDEMFSFFRNFNQNNQNNRQKQQRKHKYSYEYYNNDVQTEFSPKKFNPNMSEEEFKKFLLQESIRLFQEWNDDRNRRFLLGEQLLKSAIKGEWKDLDSFLSQNADLDNRLSEDDCNELELCENYIGYTVLHIAIWQDPLNVLLIKKLIKSGAPVNSQTESGMTPLHLLLCRTPQNGIFELVKLLVKKGAFPHFLSKKNNSPLHIAIEKKHFTEAIFLIENSTWTRSIFARRENSNMRKNENGLSPLELTLQCIIDTISKNERNEYWQVVNALLKRGNEVEVSQSCLEMIVEKGIIVPEFIRVSLQENKKIREEILRNQIGCFLM